MEKKEEKDKDVTHDLLTALQEQEDYSFIAELSVLHRYYYHFIL